MRIPDDGRAAGSTYCGHMESLIQLEYILEHERHQFTGRQHQPDYAGHIATACPMSDYLRRLLDLFRTPREAMRFA